MNARGQDYSLRQMLAELIDERIPGPDPSRILKTYMEEALALPEGRQLLGTFVAPKTGRTVGTALVRRGHSLLGYLEPPHTIPPSSSLGSAVFSNALQGLRLAIGGGLLRFLMDAGVCLRQPDRWGCVAMLEGLQYPKGSFGSSGWSANQLRPAHLEELFGQASDDPTTSLLLMDGNFRTIASVAMPKQTVSAWADRLEDSLKRMPGGPEARVEWLQKAEVRADPAWASVLGRLTAQWTERLLESDMPTAQASWPRTGRV